MRRLVKWIIRFAAIAIAASFVLMVVLLTGPGQRMALSLIASVTSDTESGLEFGRLRGSLLSAGNIDRITLRDREGAWLVARDIRFSWRPLSLTFGRLEVDELAVGRVEVMRKPIGSKQSGAEPVSSEPMSLPGLAFVARRFEVSELVLAAPVIGVPARLDIKANANLVDRTRGLSAELLLSRLDSPGGKVQASLVYRPHGSQLEINAIASEPAGGLVTRLLELPGQPPLAMKFAGTGSINQWRAQWSLSAADRPFVAGTAAIDKIEDRHRLDMRFEGHLDSIVPATLSGILAGRTTGEITGSWMGLETFNAERISLSSDALNLQASGGIDVEQSYFFGSVSARLARGDKKGVHIALSPEHAVSINSLDIRFSLPNSPSGRHITADLKANGIAGEFGSLAGFEVNASADQMKPSGKMALDAHNIKMAAKATGVQPKDAGLAQAIGSDTTVTLTGKALAKVLTISALRIATAGSSVTGSGKMEDRIFSGTVNLKSPDLSRFSGLVGRRVAGKLGVRLKGQMETNGGPLRVSLAGTSSGLKAGNPIIDNLLAGMTSAKGTITRAENGEVVLKNLSISNDEIQVLVKGRAGGKPLSLDARADVRDLSKVSPTLKGSATLKTKIDGTRDSFTSHAVIEGQDVVLNGRNFTAPKLSFAGEGSLKSHSGVMKIAGRLDNQPISGSSQIAFSTDGAMSFDDFKLVVATARAAGRVKKPAQGNAIGKFTIDLPQLADLSPFVGQPMNGAGKATIEFGEVEAGSEPVITLYAAAPSVHFGEYVLHGIDASAEIRDYVRAMRIAAKARLARLESSSLQIQDLRLDADDTGGKTNFKTAAIVNDHHFNLKGNMAAKDTAYEIELSAAAIRKGKFLAQLDAPARLSLENGGVNVRRFIIKTDGGRTEITGSAGSEKINLSVALKSLPARIANMFDKTLGLEGHIDGRIAVQGAPASPHADAKIKWRAAAARLSRAQHLPPLNIDMQGQFADKTVKGKIGASGIDGLILTAAGTLGVESDSRMKVRIEGKIPLSLANGALAARAAQVTGAAKLTADASGTLTAPKIAGKVSIGDVTVNDPASGLKLIDVAGSARFTRTSLTIDKITGRSAKGGTLSGRGALSQMANGTMNADVSLDLVGLKFDDRQLMSGEVDGKLKVKGALQSLHAGGTIGIKRLDVTIPNSLPRSITNLDLKHVNAPKNIQKNHDKPQSNKGDASTKINLDLKINAANRIFVRGRGVDAQLGGDLRIHGTADNPVADGGFDMERGRLSILGRQLDFKRGKIIFDGSVEPVLDMEASAAVDDVTVLVLVTGAASSPVFKFSSVPELPEDEVVARLLFNKSLAGLSPVQLAQLAGEIDKIGGLSSGPSMFDRIKSSLGVDVLDVTTDKKGGTAVSAGSYLNEKTYVGVRQGTSSTSSRVVIDHDLTKSLKARGELGADGNSKIGIGVEWDY